MSDCIFCKIIKGDIPCSKVYEDDNILAFDDIQTDGAGACNHHSQKTHRNTYGN